MQNLEPSRSPPFKEASNAGAFIEALRRLEEDRDDRSLVAMFSDVAQIKTVGNPHLYKGVKGAQHFWQAYRKQFDEIHSHFVHVLEKDGHVALEWESEGTTPLHHPFAYEGVSLLEFVDGQIVSFRTYFDTAEFLRTH